MLLRRVPVCLSLLLCALCSCGSEGEPSRRADEAQDAARFATQPPLQLGELRIARGGAAPSVVRFSAVDGTVERLGLSLRLQFVLAWDIPGRHIEGATELQEGPIDVRARPADGRRATAESMIREGLPAHFGLVARIEKRLTPVLALRRSEVGLELATSQQSVAEGSREPGNYRVTGARIGDLVAAQPGVLEVADAERVRALYLAKGKREGLAAWVLLFYALWHRRHVLGQVPDGDVFDVLSQAA